MLPAERRLTRSADFGRCVRRGARGGSSSLTVHLLPGRSALAGAGSDDPPAMAGLVVSKAVGNAVVRNRVARRLRHLLAERLPEVDPGALLVVRAHPAAADASSTILGADLDRALLKAVARA